MVKCTFCGATHVPNTIFCRECGTYLIQEEDVHGTDPLGTEELGWIGKDVPATDLTEPDEPKSIHLEIIGTKRIVESTLASALLLGRIDPSNNVFPDIDLTNESGLEGGVSRRHAQILKHEGHIVIEDMGSLNGTFINGKRLPPYYLETLHHGDQLQLGKLLIDISLH